MSLWCYLFAVLSPIPCSRYTSVTLTFSISEMMDYALDESPANITAGPACIWAIADTRIAHILRQKLVFIQSCGGFTCCHCSTWIWWIIWSFGSRDGDWCFVFQQWHIFPLFMDKMECFGLGRNSLFHWLLWFGIHQSKTNHVFRPETQTWKNHTSDLLFFYSFWKKFKVWSQC